MNNYKDMHEDYVRFQKPKTVAKFADLSVFVQQIIIAAGREYVSDYESHKNDIFLNDGAINIDIVFEYIEDQINGLSVSGIEDDDEDLSLIRMCARAWMWMNYDLILYYFIIRESEAQQLVMGEDKQEES